MVIRWFHYASYLKYPMFLVGGVMALPELVNRSQNCIENIGLGLFFFGMGLTLDGLKAEQDFTKSEIKAYSKPRSFKAQLIFSSSFACLAFLLGIFFFLVPLFWPSVESGVYDKIKSIGFGAFSLSIGSLVMEKQRYERFKAYCESIKE
ncbi:hypothetical protein KAR48_06755 [bacterium]|nr:hypothetical protein [bacterium]